MSGPRTSRRGFLALCGTGALAGCTAPTTQRETATAEEGIALADARNWGMFGNDARHASHNPEADPPDTLPGFGWQSDVAGSRTMAAPALLDGTLFLASGGAAYAMEPVSGSLRWQTDVSYKTFHFPPAAAVVDGAVTAFLATRTNAGARLGGGEGRLYALTGEEGAERWTFDRPISGSPTVANGRLYLPSTGDERGRLHALDPATGGVAWSHTVEGGDRSAVYAAAAVTADAVRVPVSRYGADATGELLTLSPADGSVRWRVPLPAPVRAAPIVGDDGTAFVTTEDGHVVAVDSEGVRWRRATGENIQAAPALAAGTLFVLADDVVLALDAGDGAVRWRTRVAVPHGTELATDGKRLFLGGNELVALSASDGSAVWAKPVPRGTGAWGSPVLAGNTVLVGICSKANSDSGFYDDSMTALVG